MSTGGAKHVVFGPYWDATNSTIYQSINLTAFDAGGYVTPKTFWTQEDKAAGSVTSLQGGTDGTVSAYFDGDYNIRIKNSDNTTTIASYASKNMTGDFGTNYETQFGTVVPSASSNNKGMTFVKMDGSNNIIEVLVSNGSSFTSVLKLTTGGDSVIDNLATKIMPVANVKHTDYGAVGDGTTDDTTAIQAAIDAIEAEGGGIVWFPEGTYKVTAKLVCDSSNVTLQGCNQGASIIKTNHATLDILELGDGSSSVGNIVIRDLLFDSSVTRSGGSAIDLYKVTNTYIQNVRFDNQFEAIGTSGSNSIIGIRDCDIRNCIAATGTGIRLEHGNDYFINSLVMDNGTTTQPLAGIRLVDVNNVFISDSHLLHSGHGILIDPQAADVVSKVFINNCKSELGDINNTGVGNGILLNGASNTSTITGISISNTLVSENADSGIRISGNASATYDGISINNCQCFENVEHGIDIERGQNIDIESCTISGNDSGDTSTFNGIQVDAGITLFKIVGNTIGQVAGHSNTQNYGIMISAGASDEFEITGNKIVNNKNGSLSDGSTGTNKVIEANLYDQLPVIVIVSLASGTSPLPIPMSGTSFIITGTSTITTLQNGWGGRELTFYFASTATLQDNSSINLSGGVNFVATADDCLTLMYNGTNWYETGRSVN